ncbi:SDR family oxidoreductase [Actinomadura gamaensis]|uniref:SDR family oxidoreductase n=1 Tax=Actinomadura gamaensis TaxID=1763541 RepID=A0ABV9TWQ4_9ACTN
MNTEQVLVTGGSGFLGAHCVLTLLERGYRVRTTVRTPSRASEVREMLRRGGIDAMDALSFATADLTADAGWADAVSGCDYVLHVASPFPATLPDHEDELIVPAREGTLRVLRAARAAGVRRVVLTSSFAAIGHGHTGLDRTFTEQDWTDLDGPDVSPYAKSKVLAERAAWDFADRGGSPELAVVNPVGLLGPVLGPDLSTSLILIQRLLDRGMPALPRLCFNLVDVRDVADLHVRAMTDPAAPGQRFIAAAGAPMWAAQVARVLKDRLGPAGARVPTRQLPNLLVRLASRADPTLRAFTPDLGIVYRTSAEKARRVLGWHPRTTEESIVASARSLIELRAAGRA